MTDDTAKGASRPKRVPVVFFDQNCINARGKDAELVRLDELRAAGRIELVANRRNFVEVGGGAYGELARARLARLPSVAHEGLRLDLGFLDVDFMDAPTDLRAVFSAIFPSENIETATNSLEDACHVANANDLGADFFITRENAILQASGRLGLRVRILSPTQLLEELEGGERA